MKDKFAEQREVFENWLPQQFHLPKKAAITILEKRKDGSYEDEGIALLFTGFCTGWGLKP